MIELTSLFIGSSPARRSGDRRGVRYLAMPGVRLETFRDGGPLAVDFERIRGRRRADRRTRGAAAVELPTDHAGRHRPARIGRGPARTGAARSRARGRRVHGAARHRGRHGAGRGPRAPGSWWSTRDLLFMGRGPLPSPWCSTSPTARWSASRAPKRAGWRRCSPAARRPDGEPGRGLDGVQPVGTRVRRARWRPSRRSAPRTSRSATRSRTAAPSTRSRTWTA